MTARFQCHEQQSAAGGFPGGIDRMNFGVGTTELLVPAFCQNSGPRSSTIDGARLPDSVQPLVPALAPPAASGALASWPEPREKRFVIGYCPGSQSFPATCRDRVHRSIGIPDRAQG